MWPDWLKAIQLKPRFLFGFWLLGLLLLFLPPRFADSVGILALRAQYRGWIGLATLAAFAFWLVQLIPSVRGAMARRAYRSEVFKNLTGLTGPERFLLAYCVHTGQRTVYMKISDGAALSLCSKGLFERAAGAGSALSWPFTVPLFVWDHVRKNPDLTFPNVQWRSSEFRQACERFERDMQSRFY